MVHGSVVRWSVARLSGELLRSVEISRECVIEIILRRVKFSPKTFSHVVAEDQRAA